MQPTGNEKPANVPGRPVSPFLAAPPSPFLASGPVVGLEPYGASRSTTPFPSSWATSGPGTSGATETTTPFLPPTPVVSQEILGPRAVPLGRFNGPSSPPHPSYPAQNANQQLQAPRFLPTAQPIPPFRGPPVVGPPVLPPPGSLRPQPQAVLMGAPMNANTIPSRAPSLSESSFSMARPTPQTPLQGYSNIPLRGGPLQQFPASRPFSQSIFQASPAAYPPSSHSPYQSQQGGFMPPPPTVGGPLAYNSREQLQFPSTGPPVGGTLQGLVEDFQSLAIGAAPGSHDPGVDRKSLPRPLDGDAERISVLESYPLNCDPRFLRLTTHAIPNSQSLLARWHLPLGAVVHPLAEVPKGEEVPVVNFGSAGIVRCRRCRTYVNPYVTFTDSGRKWRCNLCSLLNDVPSEYFCALDASGRRCDIDQRPELSKGSVEFVAPTEYMVRPPMPPLYFFLIDVSVSAVRSGVLEVIAKTIKDCLDELPGFPRTQIGFLTFDSTLHFYNLKSSLTQPQMIVVSDIDDIFLPLPDDLLVNLADSRSVVDALLDSLPSMFQDNVNVESAFGPALKAAYMVMSQLGGSEKTLARSKARTGAGVRAGEKMAGDPRITWEGCSVLLDINDGDRLVFARLSPNATVKIGAKKCPLSSLIGCPFGSLFRVDTGPGGRSILTRCAADADAIHERDNLQVKDDHRDNRALVDNNKAQNLSSEDIDAMRREGATGDEIVEALIANSSTFDQKTMFSQEKYKLKKQKKYAPKVLLRRPFCRSICEAYFKKHPARIGFLRMDTLSLLLSMANVSAYSDVLVVDMVGGMLTGAVAERLGGTGYICSTYFGAKSHPLDIVRMFNFNSEVCSRIVQASFSDLCTAQTNKNGCSPLHRSSHSSDIEPTTSIASPSTESVLSEASILNLAGQKSVQEENTIADDIHESNVPAVHKSVNPGKQASPGSISLWKGRGFTSLIIAAPELEVGSMAQELLPLLSYSAPFAIYQQYLEPLATCMHRLQSSKMAINLQISEPWLREYQVLPSRTHPHMQMSAFGGYILSGIRICDNEVCNGNK